jgi:hypothetical protein
MIEYNASPAAKARTARNHKSEKGRATRKRNDATPIGKARIKRQQDRRKARPGIRTELSLQEALRRMMKIEGYDSKILSVIGCTRDHFVKDMEAKMKTFVGMTWENYGYGSRGGKRRGWDVDHLIPKSRYDHSNADDIKRCWNLTNLMPAWHQKNLEKSDKVTPYALSRVPDSLWPAQWNGRPPL